MAGRIVVVGSSNTDMVVQVPKLPKPGETVLGGEFLQAAGGKGANQAVAAARLGAEVIFLGRVGQDSFGRQALQDLEEDGIDVSFVVRDEDHSSGVALIMVDHDAENMIAVASGANLQLRPEDVERSREVFRSADVLLCQLEVPLETVEYACGLAREFGLRAILNPAPAASLPERLYQDLDVLTPNAGEAATLLGLEDVDAGEAAERLCERGVECVIVTRGAEGAFVRSATGVFEVPGKEVEAVDTTAAGDAFNGALACALSEDRELEEAVRFANEAAAVSVTRSGAQPSLPRRSDLSPSW